MNVKLYDHIERKIKTYDMDNGTHFYDKLMEKVNKPDTQYYSGIVHGFCLALVELEIITGGDAVDILELRRQMLAEAEKAEGEVG